MYRLALYGKGGIGKSTTVCNIATTLAARGHTVMQIGCDPKADSTRLTMHGAQIPTVLDLMRADKVVSLEELVWKAPSGVLCVEAGGPVPGIGCAGRGIITAFEQLEKLGAYREFQPDFVLYDVLGDVVCGGFAMPLRKGYSDAVMVVTSGEMMSLYAASNIIHAVSSFQKRGYARLKGLIANLSGIADEEAKIAEFCSQEHVDTIVKIPRSAQIQEAEDACKPVVELLPRSDLARKYEELTARIEQLERELSAEDL